MLSGGVGPRLGHRGRLDQPRGRGDLEEAGGGIAETQALGAPSYKRRCLCVKTGASPSPHQEQTRLTEAHLLHCSFYQGTGE